MERTIKCQVIKELMEEISNEAEKNTKKYNKIRLEYPERTRDIEIIRKLTHLIRINNKLRNAYNYLELKLIKLEEEA